MSINHLDPQEHRLGIDINDMVADADNSKSGGGLHGVASIGSSSSNRSERFVLGFFKT